MFGNKVDILNDGVKKQRQDGEITNPENITPEIIEFLVNHEVRRCDASRNIVLMTYDDMGNRERFNTILDAYLGLEAKATFFLPGGYQRGNISLRNYSSEIERIVTEGHVLGCHGLIHDPLTTYSSDQIRRDIEEWFKIIGEIIPGYQVKYFRAPFGDSNERVRRIFAEYGLQHVLWSLCSGGIDENTLQNISGHVQAGDIVLSHNHRFYDAFYASRIVDHLLNQGYKLETVASGLKPSDYPPSYCFQGNTEISG